MSYPVVILAGGLATRLRPMTQTIPKSLVLVNEVPYVDHQLRLLEKNGIREVIFCLGYLGEMIEHHVGNGHRFGLKVKYVYDGPTLLGTAGAIRRALPCIEAQAFYVLYGDSYLSCDYSKIQTGYQCQSKLGLMTVFRNEGQWDTSNVEFVNGAIVAYDKHQRTERMRYIDYGLGIFDRCVFESLSENQVCDLAIIYQHLLVQHQLAAYEVKQRFYEVGSFAGIKELEHFLQNHS